MWSNKDVDHLYVNDAPKFMKCIRYGLLAALFWFVVAALGYHVRDEQSPKFILNYALYWNLLTITVNILDKLLSGFSSFGVSEDILHFLTLLGGAPSTVFAMVLFKQKSKKPSYQETFFTWCGLSSLWMIFVCFIVYSYQHVFIEIMKH